MGHHFGMVSGAYTKHNGENKFLLTSRFVLSMMN